VASNTRLNYLMAPLNGFRRHLVPPHRLHVLGATRFVLKLPTALPAAALRLQSVRWLIDMKLLALRDFMFVVVPWS